MKQFIICLIFLFSLAAQMARSADFYVDNMPYYIISHVAPSVKIAMETYEDQNMNLSGDVVIPETVSHDGINYTVTRIDGFSFGFCDRVTSWYIPKSVVSLGPLSSQVDINVASDNPRYASIDGILFNKNLTKLICYPINRKATSYTVPSSVQIIYTSAFHGCKFIEKIILGNAVTEIQDMAFAGCNNLKEINLPTSLRAIGNAAFGYCRLQDIIIPAGLTTIGVGAFRSYWKINSISIPASVTIIGEEALNDCKSLYVVPANRNYCTEGGVLFNKAKTSLIRYPICLKNNKYIVPATVKRIEKRAFSEATFSSLILPSSLLSIGDEAFWGCTNFESMIIPQSLTWDGKYPFFRAWNSKTLKRIEVDPANTSFRSIDGVLYNKAATKLLCCPQGKAVGVFTVPSSVRRIDCSAFYENENLTKIILNQGLTEIGSYSFFGCSNLVEMNIPDTLKSIEDCAFGWTKLQLNLPSGIKLGNELFGRNQ